MPLPPYISPTVKKAQVYDARTGKLIQEAGDFTPSELDRGAGKFAPAGGGGGGSVSFMRSHTPMEGKRSIGINVGGGGGLGAGGGGGAGVGRGMGGGGVTYNPFDAFRRFGNKGGRMAPASPNALAANGRSEAGSLTDFYASRTVDPATGMPLNPSSMDQFNARAMNETGGLFKGGRDTSGNLAPGGGFAGFQRQGILNAYNQGVGSLNPFLASSARQALINQQAQKNALSQIGNPEGGSAGGMIDWTKVPGGINPNATLSGNNSGSDTSSIDWVNQNPTGLNPQARAKGGSVNRVNPYLVGEEGIEEFVPKNGAPPELVGTQGPEVRTFPEDGKIIPFNKITARAEGGKVAGSQPGFTGFYNPFSYTNPAHEDAARFLTGVPEYPSLPAAPIPAPYGQFLAQGSAPVDPSYFTRNAAYGMAPSLGGMSSVFGRALGGLANRPSQLMAAAPAATPIAVQATLPAPTQPITPDAYQNTGEDTPDAFNPLVAAYAPDGVERDAETGDTESTPVSPDEIFAAKRSALNRAAAGGAVERMTNIPNVRTLAPAEAQDQTFLTPYGKAGVSFGAPKKEAMIYDDVSGKMIPSTEFFQRIANRQGAANAYAQPSKGAKKMAEQAKANERSLGLGLPIKKA